jgi:hypothetical protein
MQFRIILAISYFQSTAMVKYCMNLETGAVAEQNNLTINPRRNTKTGLVAEQKNLPRRNTNLERVIHPRNGFRPVDVPLQDLPVQLQAGRERLRARNNRGI